MSEEWRSVSGYEGLYEISNCGRIKSLERKVQNTPKSFMTKKEHILVPYTNGLGYKMIVLRKDGNAKKFFLHRLVAMSFIPNEEGKKEIDHKDGNPSNNNAENLQWATRKENMNNPITRKRTSDSKKGKKASESARRSYSNSMKKRWAEGKMKGVITEESIKKMKETKRKNRALYSGENSPVAKKIVQMSLNGEIINVFVSQRDAAEKLGLSYKAINLCCRGKIKTSGGFKWKYYE